MSVHYVARLSRGRARLAEYKRFRQCKVEIQIRSILQHAWAEIEHDLGYKAREEIPRDLRRRFSRLAGSMETADAEFKAIRDELQRYVMELPKRIERFPETVDVDKESLAFFAQTPIIKILDQQIAVAAGGASIEDDSEYMGELATELQFLDLATIESLQTALEEYSTEIVPFAFEWLSEDPHFRLASGISLFYLCYTVLANRCSPEQIARYAVEMGFTEEEDSQSFVDEVIQTHQKVSSID